MLKLWNFFGFIYINFDSLSKTNHKIVTFTLEEFSSVAVIGVALEIDAKPQ